MWIHLTTTYQVLQDLDKICCWEALNLQTTRLAIVNIEVMILLLAFKYNIPHTGAAELVGQVRHLLDHFLSLSAIFIHNYSCEILFNTCPEIGCQLYLTRAE